MSVAELIDHFLMLCELSLDEARMRSDEIGQKSLGVLLEGSEFIGVISLD